MSQWRPQVDERSAAEREAAAQGNYGYSKWDRIKHAFASRETQPIDEEALAYEARVGVVEHTIRDGSPAARAELAAEFRDRWDAVRSIATRKRWFDRYSGLFDKLLIIAFVLYTIWAVWTASLQQWYRWAAWTFLLFLFGLFRSRSRAELPSNESAIAACWSRHCPDCGYDLSGSADAVDPGVLEGLRVGPGVCSECLSKWPLFPPSGSIIRSEFS